MANKPTAAVNNLNIDLLINYAALRIAALINAVSRTAV